MRSLIGLAHKEFFVMGMHASPRNGIPIPEEIHMLYSDELKEAWEVFHTWWTEDREGPPRRSEMPDEVAEAMKLICETPIPTMKKATGADSCYMIGVNSRLID